MKRLLTFFILFLIAGSVTALGYSLYRIGIIGQKGDLTQMATSTQANKAIRDSSSTEKDLSWMKDIKGISEEDAKTTIIHEETTSTAINASTSSTTIEVTATSTSATTESIDEQPESDTTPSIQDLGKADALTSTAYDFAFKQLVLSAELRHGTIFLTWTPATSETFLSYKVLRSTTDENPYLPKSPSIKSLNDITQTAYTDPKVQAGRTYYYRICMTKQGKPSACGNIIKISL